MEKLKVGTLIEDNGKLGVITKVIEMGTLNVDSDIIKWRANYEVHYADGIISIIACATISRLIDEGKVKIVSYPATTPLPYYPTASYEARMRVNTREQSKDKGFDGNDEQGVKPLGQKDE
tara:strand:+ start:226 stop:585 length:360 start_codon:yes stop_codon:yes gene_type:complete